jgi:hypothetical protein
MRLVVAWIERSHLALELWRYGEDDLWRFDRDATRARKRVGRMKNPSS